MIRLLRFSIRHPGWVLALTAVLVIAAAAFVPRIRLRLDARSLIPQGHPSMAASDRAAELFEVRDVVVVALSDAERGMYTPRNLRLLSDLSAELAKVDGIVPDSIASLATIPRLSVVDDVVDLQPLLDAAGEPSPEVARRVRRETAALGLDDGIFASPDGRTMAIYAEVEPEADRSLLGERVRAVVESRRSGGADVYFSGTAMAQAVLGESAARDLIRLVPFVLLVVFSVLFLAFRHPVPALISLAEVGVSLVCTAGLLGLFGRSVFVTTLVLPVILIVIGVTDDVYALSRFFDEARQDPGRPVREVLESSFSAIARPVTLTAATTITGFLSLGLTALEPQRILGIYGAVAVALSTVMTFSLVPALLVLFDPKPKPAAGSLTERAERLVVRLLDTLRRGSPRRLALGAAVVALVCLGLAAWRLRIEDNWIGNLPPRSSTVQGDRAINRLLAGTNTLELMIDSGRPQGFLEPRAIAALGALEDALAASPDVGAVHGAFGDIVRVNASLAGADGRAYRRALSRRKGVMSRAEIEQALLLIASTGSGPAAERLDPEARRARVTVFVRSANYSRMSSVLRLAADTVRRHFPAGVSLTPFGDGLIGHESIRLLVTGQIVSIGFAVLANLGLLLLLFRSLRTSLVAITPTVFSILFVFGVLAALDAPLGTASSMFAAIALGIGVDYSIHLVASFRGKHLAGRPKREALAVAIRETGPAILTSAVAIVAGFSVLTLSEVPPNRLLGLLVCLSLAVCAAATLILVPTLFLVRDLPGEEKR